MSHELNQIDWTRVAAPQADGYDTRVVQRYLAEGPYSTRPVRPVPEGYPLWPDFEGPGRLITMADHTRPSPELFDQPPDHTLIQQGLQLLTHWPGGERLCQELVRAVCPLTHNKGEQIGHGCTCGHFGDDWGWLYVTADNAWGFVEGLVHEIGHWKLRAFGIWFETWDTTLLANSPADLYDSPVRKDVPRPMGAVLHAQYSYIHVAQLCVRVLASLATPTKSNVDWTQLQLDRITEGQATVRAHATPSDEAGADFLHGLDAWTTDVLAEGHATIARVDV